MAVRVRDRSRDLGKLPSDSPGMVTQVRSHFAYTMVENLGLCVELTDDLQSFLDATCWAQIVVATLGALGAGVAMAGSLIKRPRSSVSMQLASLAAFDLMFLASSLGVAALALARWWSGATVKVFLSLRTLTFWGVAYVTLDISLERLLSVARPFLAERYFTVTFALRRTAINLLMGVAFTLPYILDLINDYSVGPWCTGSRRLTMFGLIYTLYLSLLLLYLLPFSAVIITNCIFACTLCRLGRRSAQQQRPSTRGLSALVLALGAWYAVSMLAPSLLFLLRLTRAEVFEPDVDLRVAAVADTLVTVSAAANCVFYFLLWRPFYHALMRWLGRTAVFSPSTATGNSLQPNTCRNALQESSH